MTTPPTTNQSDTRSNNSLSTYFGAILLVFCTVLFVTILKYRNEGSHCEHTGKSQRTPITNSNTAVCVSGQLRTLTLRPGEQWHPGNWDPMSATIPYANQTVAESVQNNLYPKLHNPDVFMVIATRESEREPKQGNLSVCEPLRPKGGHLNCSVPLEEPLETLGNYSFWDDFANPYYVGIQGVIQQMKGMYDCYKQIQKHSIATGKKYEWIIRLRPDMYVYQFPDIDELNKVEDIEKKILYANKTACCCGNEDTFAVGKYDLMSMFLERFVHMEHVDVFQKGRGYSSESHLMDYMAERGVSMVEHGPIQTCIIKPTYRSSISQPR